MIIKIYFYIVAFYIN